MRFQAGTRHRAPREAVVPMINVVFLLLIFFLMTAVVSTPPPFDMVLPDGGEGAEASVGDALYIGADGELAFEVLRGEAVYEGLASRSAETPLLIRADQGASAVQLAAVMARLAALGITEAELVTVQR